ncbi:DUF2516 family protein [Arthrobacter halodurans]|jgi:hypothetical protein|uniref:DUF2516 family protein n=1 Tax=Arthrobacter halodurans TaxID=516699 RepID=A0ABV4UPQ0_9MICC
MALIFEYYLFQALSLVALVLAVWAFVDSLRHPANNYLREGKRTKGFWMGLAGASAAVCVFSFFFGSGGGFLQLIAACIAAVYLADVRPNVSGKGTGYYNY